MPRKPDQDVEFRVTVERIDRRIPDPDETPTITVKRYAEIMGIGLRTAYAAIEAGDVPCIRIGRRRVIPTRQAFAALLGNSAA
jgi:excisionase family DNA binding protein